MSPTQLSVLLPCRDAAEHLPQAIRSLQWQTYQGYEVIAVDDGSRDGTGDVLERWAERDKRVRVIRLAGEGLPDALRAGSDHCRGQLLARADADDVIHPRRFAEQVKLLESRADVSMVGTGVRYFPRDEVGWGARRYERWLNKMNEPGILARDVFVECPIAHPTMMMRRAVFDEVNGYQANGWPEDYDLVLRLHVAGKRLANVPRVLHFWRESDDRASRTDPRYSAGSFRRCKIHYLRESILKDHETVNVWGAGRVGKDFARALAKNAGVRVRAFYDIDPRKIGQEIQGAPVREARNIERDCDGYLLVAVGAPGARELIREQLERAGFEEPRDYCCVA